jgi:hypothetical protein
VGNHHHGREASASSRAGLNPPGGTARDIEVVNVATVIVQAAPPAKTSLRFVPAPSGWRSGHLQA